VAFYTNYTGVPQPLTELSLLVVPGKHGSSCGWGLLLFSDQRFLVHDVRPTLARRPPAQNPPRLSRRGMPRWDRSTSKHAHTRGGMRWPHLQSSDVNSAAVHCTASAHAGWRRASARWDSKLHFG